VGFGVGFGVGLGVGFGVALIPQFVDDDADFVGPLPADGIVANPSGAVPVGGNSLAAIFRIALRSGFWMDPRSSYVPLTSGLLMTTR
jgi:hypothetical protein